MTAVFVILHYMVMEETIQCVKDILKLKGEKKIVIVDNASPNNSGKALEKRFGQHENVHVIVNDRNEGFARGNNIGCAFARAQYDPDYYIVMNNDVEVVQDDFISRIESIWSRAGFDVLGPDIYATTTKEHQNPKSVKRTDIKGAKKVRDAYGKKINSKVVVPIRCVLKHVKLLKRLNTMWRGKRKGADHKKEYQNVVLHGACLIFSRAFVASRKDVFYPQTFFYYETEILDYECRRGNRKVIYSPDIKVLHHQNVSTKKTYKNEIERTRFMNKQVYDSVTSFLETYSHGK